MTKSHAKGKKFYELANQGLSNHAIASRCGEFPHTVGARISEYRKAMDLPPPRRHNVENGFTMVNNSEKARRERNLEDAVRREDGVLECPVKYCAGYGYDRGEVGLL